MKYYNINTKAKSDTLPRLPNTLNTNWNNYRTAYMDAGWRECIEGVIPEGKTEIPNTPRDYVQGENPEIVNEIIYCETPEEKEVREALEEQERQNNKPQALKAVENSFYELCNLIFGDYTKRGFDEIKVALENLLAVDPNTSVVLSVKLLGIDAEGKREGGLQWWDDAVRHV